jgi:hypothetical protein
VAARAKAFFEKEAAGNAVAVQRLLAQEGLSCSLRTTQRALTSLRAALRRAQAATVRFETAPGKTHQQLQQTFAVAEQAALEPLPARPAPARTRRVRRKVANDTLVNVDTVCYSVPNRHFGETVEVTVGEVQIYSGQTRIANHARSSEPHSTVSDMRHYDGLLQAPKAVPCDPPETTQAGGGDDSLTCMSRSLQDYALVVEGASRHNSSSTPGCRSGWCSCG